MTDVFTFCVLLGGMTSRGTEKLCDILINVTILVTILIPDAIASRLVMFKSFLRLRNLSHTVVSSTSSLPFGDFWLILLSK